MLKDDTPDIQSTQFSRLDQLFEQGIKVASARFSHAINNADKVPSNYYDVKSGRKDRIIDMSLTPIGLLCRQKGEYWLADGHIEIRFMKGE